MINKLMIFLILVSCTKVQLTNDEKKDYKLNLEINLDNAKTEGVMSAPLKPSYYFSFETDEKINFISFKTCSREVTATDPRVGVSRKKINIQYVPNEIERNRGCSATVNAYNETGMFETGFIVFPLQEANLSAVNICGSQETLNLGSSVCQGRIDSIEKIKFDVEVLASPDLDCPLTNTRGKEFIYHIQRGYCLYLFKETKPPYRLHRLTSYGYSDIQIRK